MEAVSVVFDKTNTGGKEYTYKTDIDFSIGDIAIVETSGEYKFVRVVGLNAGIDPDAPFEYAWIIQKLDLTAHEKRVAT